MGPSPDAHDISRSETIGSWMLWFGVLGAPLAWLTQLVVNYSLEEWFSCSPSVTEVGEVLGMSVRTVGLIVTLGTGLVAVGAGVASVSCFRKTGGGDERSNRPRWMAIAGIMNSVLYLLFIVVGVVPTLILNLCEASP